MSGRRLLTRRGLLAILGLLLLCGLLFLALSRAPGGRVAVVEKNGEEIARRELSALAGPEELSVEGEDGLTLTVVFFPDGAEVSSADCPDQVCVRTGKITRAGETAVCLPARVTLRLEGGGGTDGETY